MAHIVIIGNGVSGVTCARHIRKRSEDRVTIISAESKFFFSRTALMYVYMGHMRFEDIQPYEPWFWEKNNIELQQAYVREVDFETKVLRLSSGGEVNYDKLVLAVGSKPNRFGWKGQEYAGVQGLYSKQDLELLESNTDPYGEEQRVKRAVIVGGGLIGIELAEMLLTRGIAVTFLVRENLFWGNVLPKGESELVMKHMAEHHVDLRLQTELDEIFADKDGRVRAIKTSGGETIDCQLVGLTAGVSPNIDFLRDSNLEVDRGILVDRKMETNIPDVYAIGDCAQFKQAVSGRRPIEQVWYTGRMMGETLARTLTGEPTEYQPGHWFNSAKFFDIEYQTYGWVYPNPREGEKHFYWEHPDGKKCIRINYLEESGKFIGINSFGIRLRHDVFDRWLTEGRSVDYVISHMRDANFDPEFYRGFESELRAFYEHEVGRKVHLKKKDLQRIFGL
ncbi:MAG: NAD(P)/FAD-dependent oxidoreductase [Flavobacteriales bacterium]|nr:NAD(P)/FAD-dependent oxidoreductase [Flavobacteriales bacterium]